MDDPILPRNAFELGKHEAIHPKTLRRVLDRLEEARTDDEAHDVIAALYWKTKILERRAERFAKELREFGK